MLIGIQMCCNFLLKVRPFSQHFSCPYDLTTVIAASCFQQNNEERRRCIERVQKQVYCDFQHQPDSNICKARRLF